MTTADGHTGYNPEAFPTDPAGLSAAWLTSVLRGSGVLETASVTVAGTESLVASGAIGRLVRITLTYDREEPSAPRTIVAKLPGTGGSAHELALRFHMYEREARFYGELAHLIDVPTPRVYYSATGPTSGISLLLLEDLAPAREGDFLHGCSLVEVGRLVEWLARLHAGWWGSPRLNAYTWLPGIAEREAVGFAKRFSGRAWKDFVRKFGGSPSLPALEPGIQEALSHSHRLAERLSERPLTLVHGDVRTNNVFYSASLPSEPIALIDWQTVCRAPGVLDLASLFINNLAHADRRAAETELLPEYHRLLKKAGVRGYTLAECRDDYRLAAVYLLAQMITLSLFFNFGSDLEEPLAAATIGRPLAAAAELNPVGLLPSVPAERFRRILGRVSGSLARLRSTGASAHRNT